MTVQELIDTLRGMNRQYVVKIGLESIFVDDVGRIGSVKLGNTDEEVIVLYPVNHRPVTQHHEAT